MLEFLSKYQCGFGKGYSTQHCLLAVLEKWKSAVDKGKPFGALLTDLSKAFDCLFLEPLLATKKFIWCATRIHSRSFIVRYLPM